VYLLNDELQQLAQNVKGLPVDSRVRSFTLSNKAACCITISYVTKCKNFRFEILTVVSVQITVLWGMTFRNLAGSCRSFGRTCWRQLRVRKQTQLPKRHGLTSQKM